MGVGYRAKAEALLAAHVAARSPVARRAAEMVQAPPRKHVSRLKGEWKAP